MRKQTNNDYSAANGGHDQFKESKKNAPVKKSPRYIYTEADLGEGILDVGIETTNTHGRGGDQQFNSWN
ncbi:MAG: hypothetical protein WBO39_00960 [Ferruginibacter sp.]